jgi:hypothetical protein
MAGLAKRCDSILQSLGIAQNRQTDPFGALRKSSCCSNKISKGGRAMFNINENQWRIIQSTVGSAFAFWLFSQIADTSFFERLWNQAAILMLGAGVIRVWMLESAKPTVR